MALAPGMGGIPFFVWLCGLVKDSFWTLLWNIFSFMLELVEFYNGPQSAAKERLRGGLLLQRWLGLRLVTDFFLRSRFYAVLVRVKYQPHVYSSQGRFLILSVGQVSA